MASIAFVPNTWTETDMAERKTRREQIVVRVEPDLREAIAAAAERDRRPVANLVRNILSDWLDSRPTLTA
jgi:hypothetical protein